MGAFATKVEATAQARRCVVGKAIEAQVEDDDDIQALLDLITARKMGLGGDLLGVNEKSVRTHSWGRCICDRDVVLRGVLC